jgi:hypothetical protein
LVRHRNVHFSRSKALVIAAAGAFSVATAVATAGPQETQAKPARPAGPAEVSAARHGTVRLTITDQPALRKAQTGGQPSSTTLVQHADRIPLAATATSRVASAPRQIAQAMLSSFSWPSSQFACLDPLWAHESGWSAVAFNAGSGAYGIPQALPGSRMASAGPDWQTNAATQIRWGLGYIKGTYGSPCGAWAHEQATGWY